MFLFEDCTVIIDGLFQAIGLFGVYLGVFCVQVGTHGDDGVVNQGKHVFQFVGQCFRERNVLFIPAVNGFGHIENGIGDTFYFRYDFEHGSYPLGVFGGEL